MDVIPVGVADEDRARRRWSTRVFCILHQAHAEARERQCHSRGRAACRYRCAPRRTTCCRHIARCLVPASAPTHACPRTGCAPAQSAAYTAGSTCVFTPSPRPNDASASAYSASGRWLVTNARQSTIACGEQIRSTLEAVQHRHRTGDRELVVVDRVGRDRDPCFGRGHAELQERAASGHSPEAVLDGGGVAGCVDHDIPLLVDVERGDRRGGGAVHPNATAARRPLVVVVDDMHRTGPSALRHLEQQKAHRSRAEDEHRSAERGPQHVVAPQHARQRLDQRGALQVHVIGQHDAPARVSAHVLSRAAGGRHTERAEREAQVLASAAAEPTGATRQRWIDGDPITDAHSATSTPASTTVPVTS